MGWKTQIMVLLVCALALGLRLTLSYFSLMHLPPSSDEAIAALLAESISRGESYPLLFTGQPYQFPIEAYLMSPIVEFFSHNSLGGRYQTLLLGLIATMGFLAVACRVFGKGVRWPSMLLIALPSSYWLIQQSAYIPPQYAISSVFAAALFFLTVLISEKRTYAILLTFVTGVVAGLSLSNHILLVSVVVAVFLVVTLRGEGVNFLVRAPVFGLGLLLGLVPLFFAVVAIPGAYEGVIGITSLQSTVDRFFQVVVNRALPGAMGVNPPYFGDFRFRVDWGDSLGSVYAIGFSIFFIVVAMSRVRSFVIQSKHARWPMLAWPDMFVMTTLLSLLLMAVNTRSAAHDHRYLMPAVWSFPFLMGYAFSLRLPHIRPMVGAVTGLLALFNVAVSVAVVDQWRREIWYYADIPHLTALRAFLKEEKVRYCYATFWLAYRITYETNDQIVCAPVFNERFKGWPLPIKEYVDQQDPVAFVLSDTVGGKFRSKHFRKIMGDYSVHHKTRRIGQLDVYYDFHYPPAASEQTLELQRSGLLSGLRGADSSVLADGDVGRAWKPNESQQSGQWIEVDLNGVSMVQRVTLHYPYKEAPPPRLLNLYGRKEGQWVSLKSRVPYQRDEMRYEHGHPIISGIHQTIRFPAEHLDRVRIEIAEPSGDHPWALSEIGVGIKKFD